MLYFRVRILQYKVFLGLTRAACSYIRRLMYCCWVIITVGSSRFRS
jgi:hypothetical protein